MTYLPQPNPNLTTATTDQTVRFIERRSLHSTFSTTKTTELTEEDTDIHLGRH